MNSLDFSIIVLCYNPDYTKLIQTLNSVFKQEGITYEVVICDDGSKINYCSELTNWIVKQNLNINIKYVFNKENRGTIINYLSGIEIAEGKYIKPISPGDYLYAKDTLKHYYDVFEINSADIVFSDAIYYSKNNLLKIKQYPESRLIFNVRYLKQLYLVYGSFFLGATLCTKKDVIKKYLNYVKDEVLFLEDFSMMTLALLDNIKIYGIEYPCIWYEYGEGISTNSKGNERIKKDSVKMIEILLNTYPNNKYVKKMVRLNKIKEKKSVRKYIAILFNFPLLYLYKLLAKTILKQKTYETSIEEMNNMIR